MRTQLTVISAAERRPPFDKMAVGGGRVRHSGGSVLLQFRGSSSMATDRILLQQLLPASFRGHASSTVPSTNGRSALMPVRYRTGISGFQRDTCVE